MEHSFNNSELQKLRESVETLSWYHTIDLGGGIVTPGFYDHRSYLDYYGLPKDLRQRSALDIGAASGFLPLKWKSAGRKLLPLICRPGWCMILDRCTSRIWTPTRLSGIYTVHFNSHIKRSARTPERQLINIYDISPQTTGRFDLVFCGSVLLHLSDPVRALWRIQSVTREAAIIATVIQPVPGPEPLALFIGQRAGDGWWLPNRCAFEAMIQCAGFKGWEWFSEFRMDYRDGRAGAYHAVIRAWNTPEKPALLSDTDLPAKAEIMPVALENPEIQRLKSLVSAYERMKCVRFMRWLHPYRRKVATWIKPSAKQKNE